MNYEILKKLLFPITVEEFFEDYWEKKVLYIPRDDNEYYSDILTFEDVNQYLSQTDIRYPHVRLVKQGKELPLIDYSYNFVYGDNSFQGVIDMDKLFTYYQEGATISFQLLQKSIKKLGFFSNKIEQEFRFPTQTNLFLTPPKSQGFTAHYDTHSFFIIHLHGEKQWKIYEESKPLPLLRERVYDVDVEITKPPMISPILKPGDFMYVPRGIYHEAMSNEMTTLQISLGLFPKTWYDVMHEAVNGMADLDVDFRKSPNPFKIENEKNGLTSFFAELCEKLKTGVYAYDFFEKDILKTYSNQIHDTTNRLNDLQLLEIINIDTIVQRRDAYAYIEIEGSEAVFKFYDKEIRFPEFAYPELQSIIQNNAIKIKEMIGDLDMESKITIVKKMVIEGFLTILDPAIKK